MKIISKYKDYYDYLIGIYGIDEKVVLDRRSEKSLSLKKDILFKISPKYSHTSFSFTNDQPKYRKISLHICGEKHFGLIGSDDVFFWGEKELIENSLDKKSIKLKDHYVFNFEGSSNGSFVRFGDPNNPIIVPLEKVSSDLNDELDCPLLLDYNFRDSLYYSETKKDYSKNVLKYPNLGELGFAKKMPPETIYQMLYSWLSARNEKNIDDNRDDISKLQSKGFDKKKSFRNMKRD